MIEIKKEFPVFINEEQEEGKLSFFKLDFPVEKKAQFVNPMKPD